MKVNYTPPLMDQIKGLREHVEHTPTLPVIIHIESSNEVRAEREPPLPAAARISDTQMNVRAIWREWALSVFAKLRALITASADEPLNEPVLCEYCGNTVGLARAGTGLKVPGCNACRASKDSA